MGTAYIVRKRCKQILGTVKAFTALRKMVRMKRAAKQWREKGRIASILGGSVLKHLNMARETIRRRKENEASLMMQTFFRSCYERKQYIKHIEKVKKSTKIIQIAYDSMKQREGLRNTVDSKVERRREDEMNNGNDSAVAVNDSDTKPQAVVETKPVTISKEKQLEMMRAERAEKERIAKEEKEAAEKELELEIAARRLEIKRASADLVHQNEEEEKQEREN